MDFRHRHLKAKDFPGFREVVEAIRARGARTFLAAK
jgi:hypothetical protein